MNIYHITHIDNLPSILETGGLLATSYLKSRNYTNIAHNNIQDRRARISVPYAARGTLHDYVPFYFAPRSPMLFTIHKGNVPGYLGGQKPIIHLVVETNAIANPDILFTYTDGHAIMEYSSFHTCLLEFLEYDSDDVIDWEVMKNNYWANTEEDPDRQRRRQAEFLIHHFCPWDFIHEIGVIDDSILKKVNEILQQYGKSTPIKIYREWYY